MENEKYLFVVSGAARYRKGQCGERFARGPPRDRKRFLPPPVPPARGAGRVDYYYRTKEQFQQLIDQGVSWSTNFSIGNGLRHLLSKEG